MRRIKQRKGIFDEGTEISIIKYESNIWQNDRITKLFIFIIVMLEEIIWRKIMILEEY